MNEQGNKTSNVSIRLWVQLTTERNFLFSMKLRVIIWHLAMLYILKKKLRKRKDKVELRQIMKTRKSTKLLDRMLGSPGPIKWRRAPSSPTFSERRHRSSCSSRRLFLRRKRSFLRRRHRASPERRWCDEDEQSRRHVVRFRRRWWRQGDALVVTWSNGWSKIFL